VCGTEQYTQTFLNLIYFGGGRKYNNKLKNVFREREGMEREREGMEKNKRRHSDWHAGRRDKINK
jgi:hypothetical protein